MSEPPHPEPTPARQPAQRIGDAERDRAAELLREHMAVGRLDQTEFDERVSAALAAKTSAELEPLFVDLPGPRPGTETAATAGFTAPPWQSGQVEPVTATPVPAKRDYTGLLAVLSAVAWPATILFISFVLGWDYWWLIFIPIMVSSGFGKQRHDREREREKIEREQRRLDERRRRLE